MEGLAKLANNKVLLFKGVSPFVQPRVLNKFSFSLTQVEQEHGFEDILNLYVQSLQFLTMSSRHHALKVLCLTFLFCLPYFLFFLPLFLSWLFLAFFLLCSLFLFPLFSFFSLSVFLSLSLFSCSSVFLGFLVFSFSFGFR
jgi:hypothetical protein